MAGSQEPDAPRLHADATTTVFVVTGPIVRSDIPELCARARAMLADVEPGRPVVCDVGALGTPDPVALDCLARLQLTARRMGHWVRLRNVSPELQELLERAGLCDTLRMRPGRSQTPPAGPVGPACD